MKEIILASASPRRQQLLNQIGIKFDVIPSSIEEVMDKRLEPHKVAMSLASQKCEDIASKIDRDCIIIAADTIVVKDGNLLGKPKDELEAFNMLKSLNNGWHEVVTGLCLYNSSGKKYMRDYEVTKVKMALNSDDFIKAYIRTGEPFDKAGAYGIQGYGSLIVEKIDGDYFNVMGLPVFRLSCMLREFGLKLLDF